MTLNPESMLHPGLPYLPRGDLSAAVLHRLAVTGEGTPLEAARDALGAASDVLTDDDVQAALFALYAAVYGSLPYIRTDVEWDPDLLATRRLLEDAVERALREQVPVPAPPPARGPAVAAALFDLAAADTGPSLARYVAKHATLPQAQEFLIQRSIYTLREADPHSWAIPRLTGRPKAALVEIQADEYGGGRPERAHAVLYAEAMRGADLDATYGAYLNVVPAIVFTSHNMMSMFGINGRHVGAIVGHLAAFEMTSSVPNRLYGDGLRRLGYGPRVTDYFDEHVEADAVHEQVAAHDLAGSLAQDFPGLVADIMFGAAACLTIDGLVGTHMLECWADGGSSLRQGVRA